MSDLSRSWCELGFAPTTLGVALALSLVSGCGDRPDRSALDLTGPRWLGVEQPSTAVSVTAEILLRFSEPIDVEHLTASSIGLVPHALGAPCSVDLCCETGRCYRGRCQTDLVDERWVNDALHPPLSSARLAASIPLDHRVVRDGELLVTPRVPLDPHRRHTLVVGALTDRAGNALVGPPGERLWRFATAGPLSGRPTVELLSPPPSTTGVPTNLARLVVRFDRPVTGVDSRSVWLDAAGGRVSCWVERGSPLCRGADACYVLKPAAELPPTAEVTLRVAEEVRDLDDRPFFGGRAPRFATAGAPDRAPPKVRASVSAVADGCYLVSVVADEPSDLLLTARWPASGMGETLRAGIGQSTHHVGLTVPAGAGAVSGSVELRDLAGNPTRFALPRRRIVAGLPPVVISEVLANPAGPEPSQELVELVNRSAAPVELEGWTIDDNDDGVGQRALPAGVLAPGRFAVVVGPRYAVGALDPAPDSTALLLRLDAPLGELGLSNRGEPLALRDQAGRLVSRYGGYHQSQARAANGASVERVDLEACDLPSSWRPTPTGGSSPGWR